MVRSACVWSLLVIGSATGVSAEPRPAAPATRPGAQSKESGGQSLLDRIMARYDQGFILVASPDEAKVPFQLKLNHVSQVRYTNTMLVGSEYVDHLGNTRAVQKRNDFQLVRDVFYFTGFAFDRRMDFNIILYTSTATLSATAAGYIGFVFHKAFALRAGFFSPPGTRAMTETYPYFHSTDRSMATNYFRPGFTQGIWCNGEPLPGLSYIAMVGNSLNTLDIKATKIDTNLVYSATVWYDRGGFGGPWNDQEHHARPALRLGSSFTAAPGEDRSSDLSQSSPENTSIFLSDGNLLFATGALAPGVTLSNADYFVWAIDAGFKFRGLALNTEFFQRWLRRFKADGPLPVSSMYDWGFDASLGYFVLRSRLELYGRTSMVRGPFGNGAEYAGGLNWYPFRKRGVWVNGEVTWVKDSVYSGVLYQYSAGATGTLFQVQTLLRF